MYERVEVYFDQEMGEDVIFRNAWIENFQGRVIKDCYFISNKSGGWALISPAEYEALFSVSIPAYLYQSLEDKCLILTASNAAGYAARYEKWTTPHFRHPVHHIIISTLRCNLSCTYCHANVVPANSAKSYDLTNEVGGRILAFALKSPAPVQSFEFQGGESLLNKDVLLYLIPAIRRKYAAAGKAVYISIMTNAILLNDEWMDFFKKYEVSVGSSMDGPKELHDSQRVQNGGNGSYDLVKKKVDKYQIKTLPTITGKSIAFWEIVIDQQLKEGKNIVAFQSVYPINHAKKNWDKIGLESDRFLQTYRQVCAYLKNQWREGYYPLERRLVLALKKLLTGRDVDFADFGNPCGMAHSQIAYHTNGDVFTCDEGRDFEEFKLGNVMENGYDEVVFGPKLRKLKSLSIPKDKECLTCAYRPFCSTCPVFDKAVTGELTSVHAETHGCRFTKLIFDTLLTWQVEDNNVFSRLAAFHKIKVS